MRLCGTFSTVSLVSVAESPACRGSTTGACPLTVIDSVTAPTVRVTLRSVVPPTVTRKSVS